MIDYLKEFEDKGFFTCANILNESEREELLSNIDQIERNVLGHPENKKNELQLSRILFILDRGCLLYTSPSPRDGRISRMPSSA